MRKRSLKEDSQNQTAACEKSSGEEQHQGAKLNRQAEGDVDPPDGVVPQPEPSGLEVQLGGAETTCAEKSRRRPVRRPFKPPLKLLKALLKSSLKGSP